MLAVHVTPLATTVRVGVYDFAVVWKAYSCRGRALFATFSTGPSCQSIFADETLTLELHRVVTSRITFLFTVSVLPAGLTISAAIVAQVRGAGVGVGVGVGVGAVVVGISLCSQAPTKNRAKARVSEVKSLVIDPP
jgi:hypothetical protein